MQRSIVAAVVALSLGACSSENDATGNGVGTLDNAPPIVEIPALEDESPAVVDVPETAEESNDAAGDSPADNDNVIVVDTSIPDAPQPETDTDTDTDAEGQSGGGSDATGGSGGEATGGSAGGDAPPDTGTNPTGDDTAGVPSAEVETTTQTPDSDDSQSGTGSGISDEAGSATSDGGETAADSSDTDAGISDEAGSTTSDGGETAADNSDTDAGISDEAGSATSDGGETAADNSDTDSGISDEAGSATSDGGENIADDAGNDASAGEPEDSGDADGGSADNTADDGNPAPPPAADFESDSAGGSVIRRSVLSAGSSVNICTTASNQQNFSDTRVGDFILHNNAWRPWRAAENYEWEQCIYTNTNGAIAGWNYDWGPGISGINGNPDPSGDYYVRSYPELIYGVKDEFRTSAPKSVTGFPVRLSELPNISISYSYNGPQYGEARPVTASNNPRFPNGNIISGERNIAVESFLYNPDASGECSENIVTRNGGSNHVYEVMVWLDAGAERLPAGPSDFVTDVNIRGEAFKVYTKGSDPRYIAFVAQNPQSTGTLVWNDFTDWARTYAHRVRSEFGARSDSVQIQDSWCVANIIVGTEIFWGAGNLDIFDWTITQSR